MNNKSILTSILIAAQNHAFRCYPAVAIGCIKGNAYCELLSNVQSDELYRLVFSTEKLKDATALIYSAPEGTMYPTQLEMELQLKYGISFGKIAVDKGTVGAPVFWGDDLPIEDVVGRNFVHGVWDCYSLVRDCYRLGANGMFDNGIIGWPLEPIILPEIPRNDDWWNLGQDLYIDHLKPVGFREIQAKDVRVGDGFLMKIRSETFNHAGVVTSDNEILHHLPTRLSRRESAGMWARNVGKWVRYEG